MQTDASFFGSAQEARDAVDIANMNSGAYFGTCCYLGDCQIQGLISEDDYAELEDGDVKVIDTYVCGNGVVIFGYDALEDSADGWERGNR